MQQDNRPGKVILEGSHLAKHFGGVQALRDVSFDLREREILALVGSNGAGKSTLVSLLAGTNRPDRGEIRMDGEPIQFKTVRDSRAAGIEIVFQDLGLAPNMDASYNLFLGRPIRKFGIFADQKAMERQTRKILADVHVSTIQDIRKPVESMSGGQRQALAVGRAVAWRKRIIILDEPAAALGPEETEQVIRLIQTLRDQGSSVIVITHNMDHVFRVADRVLIMRHGSSVSQLHTHDLEMSKLVNLIMLGEDQP
ncbi:ATP-binding cassette domain-containing protein [bacterium RCC_150]